MDRNRDQSQPSARRTQRALAWSVHAFTASGVICCLLALEATIDSQWRVALIWLAFAVLIDAVDGTLARGVRVKQVLPGFDGALLDNLVDYISYVVIPAIIIHRAHLLPESLSFAIMGAICMASAWQFCQEDAKTADHFFRGFPSYWNIVALYLLSMNLTVSMNAAIVITLIILIFVPVKYIYLSRNTPLPVITWPATIVWTALACVLLWQLPAPHPWLLWGSLVYVAWYFALSVVLTIR